MFCTESDFELLPYNIPNLSDPLDENANDGTFEDYCDQVEAEVLEELLGLQLYEEFTLALAGLTPDVWWTRLRDGYSYSEGDKTYTWKGMTWLLKPYVWFMWMRDNETKKTQEGGSVAVAENSERVSLAKELSMAYNDFAKRSGFVGCGNSKNSLYGFLASDKEHYGNWDSSGADIEYINHYNI